MKRYINKAACGFILALASLLLCGSCTREPLDSQAPVVSGGDGLDITVHFTVPGTFQPDTRAFTEAQESDVNDLLLFAFKGGVLSYVRSATTINNVAGNRKSFAAHLKVSQNASDTYKLMILANVDTSLYTILGRDFNGLNGKTYDELQKQLSHSDTTLIIGGRKWMPMWGETAEVEISGSKPIPSIGLLRSMARIDVGVNAAGFDANGVATSYQGLPDFSITDLRFATWHYAASYIPSPSNFVGSGGSISVTAPTLAHSQTGNYRFYQGPRSSVHSSVREMYVMEHDVKQGEIKPGGTLHQNRAALIVAGNYKATGTRYYRVDFVDKSGNLINILRNNLYQINITEVSGIGYSTPEEAYMYPSVNMVAEVITINDLSMTDVVYDGSTYLSVDKRALGFNSQDQALPVVDPAKPIMEHVVTVRTNSGSPVTLVGGDFEFNPNDPTQTQAMAKEIITGNIFRLCNARVNGINNGPGVESIYTITFSVSRYGGKGFKSPQWSSSFGLAIGKLRSPIEVVCDETKQYLTVTLVGVDNFALSGGGMIELDITSSSFWSARIGARGCFATFSDADVPLSSMSGNEIPPDKPKRIKVNFPRKITDPGTVDGVVEINVTNGNPFIGELSETIMLYQKRHTIWAEGPITHTGTGDNARLEIATDPNDGGVFFKPGSVIATASGPGGLNYMKGLPSYDGDRFTFDDIVFNPSNRVFDSRPLWIQWNDIPNMPNESLGTAPRATPEDGFHVLSNILKKGWGDPCRLVGLTIDQIKGGMIDNKQWRLPTHWELDQDFNHSHSGVRWNQGAVLQAQLTGKGHSFVASGIRYGDSGSVGGSAWTNSMTTSTPAHEIGIISEITTHRNNYMYFILSTPNITSQTLTISTGASHSGEGMTARCVRQ